MTRIAALYIETGGCYFGLPDVDPWDERRDARLYEGPWPVVAHPPCQRWGRFWHGSTAKPHQYRMGDDKGCFAAALHAVRIYGGVLEHPKDSHAWRWFGLNKPPSGGGVDQGRRDRRLGLLRLAGALRAPVGQADMAVCPRDRSSGPDLGEDRAAIASGRAGAPWLREGTAHRRHGHGRREGQDPYPQRHAGAVPRHSDRHGAIRRREGR